MYTATSDWYQQQGNWCEVASIRAIQVYDWLYYNRGNPQWDNSQTAIYNRLNSYTSPWGPGGGYVTSDILSKVTSCGLEDLKLKGEQTAEGGVVAASGS